MPEQARGLIPVPRWAGVAALLCSGFAGLVYEAAWARYLKQVLGHEAYAQALVIGIFLGGLAIGAALAGRRVRSWQSPLVIYAAIEAVLALLAVQFHDIFVFAREVLESGALGSGELVRWLLATALILPQSILLGATFPLLTAALARSHARSSGGTISLMYFANSLGGVIGALAVAFVLVELAGLPGSMLFGAIGSAVAALVAWISHHRYQSAKTPLAMEPRNSITAHPRALLALTAFGVGFSALVLEIIWIRMMALVLGSSTRAFELILAAFILGLALGSLLAERFADRRDRGASLALVLLMMGTLSVASIFLYEYLFFLQGHIRLSLPRSDSGYLLYGLSGFLLAILMMAGPTICSGMTLPLLTRMAISESGERALGSIYAWNSLGSIVGVVIASQIFLPVLGLKLSIGVGALVALCLALMFLRKHAPQRWNIGLATAAALVALLMLRAPFDQLLLTSGPYRNPETAFSIFEGEPTTDNLLLLQHGKTASIAVVETGEEGASRSIYTNGKPEGALPVKISTRGKTPISGDFITTMMLGGLPLLYHPEAKRAALVGIGTGYTGATLLDSAHLEKLVALEIEESVIDARVYFPLSAALYEDPRSEVRVVDAKVYFSGVDEPFDIIVSEPSNPWVSGVSSLFTVEHFQAMRSKLADDGLLVQWFHTYESSLEVMTSILLSLAEVFPDYVMYMGGTGDLIVIASSDLARLAQFDPAALEKNPRLAQRLKILRYHSLADVTAQSFADRQFMEPYLGMIAKSSRVPLNSDYFPVLDSFAAKDFYFSAANAIIHTRFGHGRLYNGNELPRRVLRAAYSPGHIVSNGNLHVNQLTTALQSAQGSVSLPELFAYLAEKQSLDKEQLATVFDPDCGIEDGLKFLRMSYLLRRVDFLDSQLLPEERKLMWQRVNQEVPCVEQWRSEQRANNLWRLYNAHITEDYPTVLEIGRELLPREVSYSGSTELGLLIKLMLSEYALGNFDEVVLLGLALGSDASQIDHQAVSLIVAHALVEIES